MQKLKKMKIKKVIHKKLQLNKFLNLNCNIETYLSCGSYDFKNGFSSGITILGSSISVSKSSSNSLSDAPPNRGLLLIEYDMTFL